MHLENQKRDQWGSKVGFILAASGSAVGLGNLWKFPFMAGQNGGGAFVLVYCIILILVGFSLMMAELVLGRSTQLSAVGAYRKIKARWAFVGGLGVLAGFLILSFYSVIGGWIIHYLVKAFMGEFNTANTAALGEMFGNFISSPVSPIVYHAIFMILTMGIVLGGIKNGIEKYSKILMPALFLMMFLTMIRAITLEGASEGIKFFLMPDFSKITGDVILSALGQVFFSLSLGMGCMITYGSYLSKDTNLPQCALSIPLIDTGVALLAGLAILPAVFAFGFDPQAGPGLLFITLPAVFSQMPFGTIFGILFFILALFAAVTSSISLLEVCVSYVVDEFKFPRKLTTYIITFVIFVVGIPSSLSQGPWSHIKLIKGGTILDSVDFIASNILLPVGGVLLCIFVGWIWGEKNAIDEVTNNGEVKFKFSRLWIFLIKWIIPVLVTIVLVRGIL